MERVLVYLKGKYKMISSEDLESYFFKNHKINNFCHITIDDGDKTFYNITYPLLKKHYIPATIFVSPHIITTKENFWFQEIRYFDDLNFKKIIAEYLSMEYDEIREYSIMHICKMLRLQNIFKLIEIYKNRYQVRRRDSLNLNVEQIKDILSDGLVSIGAHTLNHPVLSNEDDQISEMEICGSINGLKDLLGCEIKYFAYPNGIPEFDFGVREKNILKTTTCKLAFSTLHKSVTINCDPLSLPRYYISKGNLYTLRAKLFLGIYWDKIRGVKFKSEEKTRTELKKAMHISG